MPDRACCEFANIETAIRELRAGRMIVVVDDEDRENEGDLTMAAELVTPEAINFMATHGRGLICLAMTGEQARRAGPCPDGAGQHRAARHRLHGLDRPDRPRRHHRHFGPRPGANDPGRGGSRAALRKTSPGRGTFSRFVPAPAASWSAAGQTEAAVDLASLAGLYPAGVICEIKPIAPAKAA